MPSSILNSGAANLSFLTTNVISNNFNSQGIGLFPSSDSTSLLPPLDLSVISPVKCVKNEIHNILTVLKLTKQFISPERFRCEVLRDEENPLVQSFQLLFDSLTYVNEFHVDETHLQPFIEVIESPCTAGPITAVALAAVNKFVVYGLIHPRSPRVATSINMLASGVLNARFPASESPTDEVVMLKILTVLVDTLRCAAGEYLTDDTVWQMVKKAYQISRQPQASHLLRSSSENILQQMVLTIFGCHKTRSTHVYVRPKLLPREINSPTNEDELINTSDDYQEQKQENHKSTTVSQLEVLRPYGVECMFKTLKFLSYLTSYGTRPKELSSHPNEGSSGISPVLMRNRTPPRLHPASNHTRTPTPTRFPRQLDNKNDINHYDNVDERDITILHTPNRIEEELALPFVHPITDTQEFCEEMRILGLSLLNIALETGGEEVAKCPILVEVIQDDICKALLLNARTKSLFLLSVTLRCVFNLFVYLKQHLKVQLEIFFNSIHLRIAAASCESDHFAALEQRELALESLLEFCREPDLMVELYENYDCDVRCTNLFERLLIFLAKSSVPQHLQVLSTKAGILGNTVDNVESIKDKQHNLDYNTLTPRTTLPERILGTTKNKPVLVFSTLHRLSLSGLLSVIHSVASRCRSDPAIVTRNPGVTPLSPPTGVKDTPLDEIASFQHDKGDNIQHYHSIHSTEDDMKEKQKRQTRLREQKEWKKRLELAAQLFNVEPTRCIASLQNLGLLSVPETASSMAEFLRNNQGLELNVIGEYLGKPGEWNADVRKYYLKSFGFKRMCVLEALKLFLSTFKLPGEAQQIERIMESFAMEFFQEQPIPDDALPDIPTQSTGVDSDMSPELRATLYTPRWITLERGGSIQFNRLPNDLNTNESFQHHKDINNTIMDVSIESHLTTQDNSQEIVNETVCDTSIDSSTHENIPLFHDLPHTSPLDGCPNNHYSVHGMSPPGTVLIRNVDTIFILSYSIIMLNTDLHNSQVKHKMTPEEFIRNNRGIDAGHNLPRNYLLDIYDCIRLDPIRLHHDNLYLPIEGETTHEEEYWENVLNKQNILGKYSSSSLQRAGLHERDMFVVMLEADSVGAILSCFEVSQDLVVIESCLNGIFELSFISTYYSQSGPLALILHALSHHINYWLTLRTQLVIPLLSQILSLSAHIFRECWLAIIEVLLKLLSLGLLPPSLTEFDDFSQVLNNRPLERLAIVEPPPLRIRVSKRLLNQTPPSLGSTHTTTGSWLTSITSLLFATGDDIDETDDIFGSSIGASPASFCFYQHTGSPKTLDGRVIFIDLPRLQPSCYSTTHTITHDLFTGTNRRLIIEPGCPIQPVSGVSQNATDLLESTCPFLYLKTRLTDIIRLDELMMDRFRHLPLQSLSSLVSTLAVLALPCSSKKDIIKAIQRHMDLLQTSHLNNIKQTSTVQTDTSIVMDVLKLLRYEPEYHKRPTGASGAFCSSIPNLRSIELFRISFDCLFCLELLTNVVCVQLHAEDLSAAVAATQHPFIIKPHDGYERGSHLNSIHDPNHETLFPHLSFTDDLSPHSTVTEHHPSVSTTYHSTRPIQKGTFLNTIWRIVVMFFDSVLRWYIIPSGSSQLSQLSITEDLIHSGLHELYHQLPGANAIIYLLQFISKSGPTQRLEKNDLLFAERLIVSILRICVRISHGSGNVERTMLCRFLRLLAYLHPQLLELHIERLVAALHQLFIVNHFGISDAFCFVIQQTIDNTLSSNILHDMIKKRLFSIDDTVSSLLALCQRCSPLRLSPFIIPRMSSTVTDSFLRSSLSSTALCHALLDIIYLWLHDQHVLYYMFLPEGMILSTNNMSDKIYPTASVPFYSFIQTLLFFILMIPEDEQSYFTTHNKHHDTNVFKSVGFKAFQLLLCLYTPIRTYLDIASSSSDDIQDVLSLSQSSIGSQDILESFGKKDAHTLSPNVVHSISHLICLYWPIWLFPLLHSFSIIAAFSPILLIRTNVIELLEVELMKSYISLYTTDKIIHKTHLFQLPIDSWKDIIFNSILLPLISYQFTYPLSFSYTFLPFETVPQGEQHYDTLTSMTPLTLWRPDSLRTFLTLSNAEQQLGALEVTRRQTHAIGFVSRHVLRQVDQLLQPNIPEYEQLDVTPAHTTYGDRLCIVISQLIHHVAIAALGSNSLQDICRETIKNTILVLSVGLSDIPEFEQAQKQLNIERLLIHIPMIKKQDVLHKDHPIIETTIVVDPLPEDHPDLQRILQFTDLSDIILQLVFHTLRRTDSLNIWNALIQSITNDETLITTDMDHHNQSLFTTETVHQDIISQDNQSQHLNHEFTQDDHFSTNQCIHHTSLSSSLLLENSPIISINPIDTTHHVMSVYNDTHTLLSHTEQMTFKQDKTSLSEEIIMNTYDNNKHYHHPLSTSISMSSHLNIISPLKKYSCPVSPVTVPLSPDKRITHSTSLPVVKLSSIKLSSDQSMVLTLPDSPIQETQTD